MRLFIVDENNKSTAYEIPDDYHMDEFYCNLNNIGNDVSDEEVHRMMAASGDAITTKNGRFIRFSDYANSSTTLAQLGFDENTEYKLSHNFAVESSNGG